MENAIAFLFILLGLGLAEIEGAKAGAFFTPSLRIYGIGFNIIRQIRSFTDIFKLNGKYRGKRTLT